MTPAETLTAAADRIERLANEATPGPWRAEYSAKSGNCVLDAESSNCLDSVARATHWRAPHDAAFIAAMNPAVAALLVPVLRAEAARAAEVERRGIRLGERLLNADLLAFAQALIGGDQ